MKLIRLSIAFMALLLVSCSSKVSVPVDALEPPTVYYIPPQNNITINYNYLPSNSTKDIEVAIRSQLDSIAAENAAYAFMTGIANPVIGAPNNVVTYCSIRPDSSISTTYIMSNLAVKQLVNRTNAQLIISLDYFALNPELTVVPDMQNYGYEAYFTLKPIAVWRVYSSTNNNVLAEYVNQDSYYWDSHGDNRQEAINNLPKFSEIANYVGSEIGQKSLKAFTPTWSIQHRDIVSSNDMFMRMAVDKVQKDNWAEAIKIWSWLVGGKENSSLKQKAAYNLAVASEVNGDYNLAVSWLDVADSLGSKKLYISEYRSILKDRLKAKKVLDLLK